MQENNLREGKVVYMIVSWMTTNRCNLKCKHCYQDAGVGKDAELTTSQAQGLIDGIARAGFKIMIFSGGEPLMRPDIFTLVRYAADAGLRPVFGTNGTLITLEVATRLRECGAAAMGISLDSLVESKHDDFRGGVESFRQTLAGIRNCRAAGLPFQVHTTMMNWNQDEIDALVDFAVAEGAVAHYPFFLIPVGRGLNIEAGSLDVEGNERLLQKLMLKQREVSIAIKPTCAPQFTRVAQQLNVPIRFGRGCLAGISYCIISPEGEVRPCAYMTEVVGDVRQQTFDEIWAESPMFKRLRTQAYSGACGTCDYRNVCGGCRARAAYYHDGDYMAADSYCAYGPQVQQPGSVAL
jgi:putative heme d1 biosynthesis radical SAM protein NirJ2